MQIVPARRASRIIAQVAPAKIDQLHLAQLVDIRLYAAKSPRTPHLVGQITGISATTLTDARTGEPYYRVDISYSPSNFAALRPQPKAFPDMPVQIYIKTGAQPAWAYLARPFLTYFSRAMRES